MWNFYDNQRPANASAMIHVNDLSLQNLACCILILMAPLPRNGISVRERIRTCAVGTPTRALFEAVTASIRSAGSNGPGDPGCCRAIAALGADLRSIRLKHAVGLGVQGSACVRAESRFADLSGHIFGNP